MKVLHGSWIPEPETDFIQTGGFYLWVETPIASRRSKTASRSHPGHLATAELQRFLTEQVGLKQPAPTIAAQISSRYIALPTVNDRPLPSPELARYLEAETPEEYDRIQDWEVACYELSASVKTGSYQTQKAINAIKLINDLHFLALHGSDEIQLGSDLLFWYHYTQSFKQIIFKEQYIPALKYREKPAAKSSSKAKTAKQSTKQSTKRSTQKSGFEIYATWEIVSETYEASLKKYIDYLPLICLAGSAIDRPTVEFFDPETLLRHCSEVLLHDLIAHTPSTAKFDDQLTDTFLHGCLHPDRYNPQTSAQALATYQQWLNWKTKITRSQIDATFDLCFQLDSAPPDHPENWQMQFLVADRKDPSLKLPLGDYWRMGKKAQIGVQQQYGKDFETQLLLNLGYAARMYPRLWQGLETDQPRGMNLTLEEAFEFLKESAWVLEDAGYRVIVPAWYTPTGRRRAKMRLKGSVSGKKPAAANSGYFTQDAIVQYQYELAIGDQSVTPQEWEQLVQAKAPLVLFRGQWMELDQGKMQQMLEFWQTHGKEQPEMSLLELMQRAATEDDLEVEYDRSLSDLMVKLEDKSQLEPLPDLPLLQGTLREYQKRGVSWLGYLEQLGLNGCLADDMGLGKSVQVIAHLVHEREGGQPVAPTLLIAPTSVVGNWQKEIAKFAPHLRAIVHHGSDRLQQAAAFKAACLANDVVITSFTLARKDEKLLSNVEWQRLVLDEAQNIKNPKAAQTRAILKLEAKHRLALTGTPVENRLLDLWSIFNFLNPGYLGKEAQFRKSFELPIQKENDRVKSTTLKKLVEPLILRRVKTDQSIINDLPDKVEQKLYTNLTKEQASLYEAVVKEVTGQLEATEEDGIQRKGMILATLMKLKQICNHPAQFLQDGSDFSTERSHKLSRLVEMVEEAIAEGESLLIFSQFTEVCDQIERHLKHSLHCNTYYIHGGTNRNKREQMITQFQDPETEPSVFVLSLKAGGVGITLTKANHVFHFDRWWNPAVEDQATDRAFRIGQKKNVFVHKFVTIGTLEEKIDQMIEDKKKIAGAVVGADESWLTELDNEAFKQLISLNKAAVLD